MIRTRAWTALVFILALPGVASAQGSTWPAAQPIKLIVPFSAGSGTDSIARIVADQVGTQINQTFVVDNRVGAGGVIGVNAVAKAEPDGYTLLFHSSTYTVTPAINTSLPYDAVKDLAAVIPVANLPSVLVTPPGKYKSVKDLVDAAKARPGALNYASAGAGSAAHLNAERFKLAAKFEAQHVPFKGGPEALREIVADRVDFYFVPLAVARGLIQEGKLAALAVSSTQRVAALPDVPTTVEAGYPNSEYIFWMGLFAPAKTPAPILERLHKEFAAAIANPAVVEKLAKLGAEPMKMSATEFGALITREVKSNTELVQQAGIKVN